MNIILFNAQELHADGQLILSDRRHAHIKAVLKSTFGDILNVGQLGGRIGKGQVIELVRDTTTLRVELDHEPPMPLDVTLCLALPRPIMLRRVLFNAAQLGVKSIHLFHSKRVEKSFWQSTTLQPKQLAAILQEGLEQAKDTIMPEVHLHKQFKPFVEDVLPDLIDQTIPILADPSGGVDWPARPNQPVTLIIGPEGGFIPYEIEHFQQLGCLSYSLGERILRVETAVTVLLSRVKW